MISHVLHACDQLINLLLTGERTNGLLLKILLLSDIRRGLITLSSDNYLTFLLFQSLYTTQRETLHIVVSVVHQHLFTFHTNIIIYRGGFSS